MTESQSVKELTGAAEASGKAFVEKYPDGPKSCDRRSDKDSSQESGEISGCEGRQGRNCPAEEEVVVVSRPWKLCLY
jgi:hypothetical protein